MSKVTSKLQVTIPKALARQYQMSPGDEIEFEAAGEVIRILPSKTLASREGLPVEERLRLFHAATERQRVRQEGRCGVRAGSRGWNREELYLRGFSALD